MVTLRADVSPPEVIEIATQALAVTSRLPWALKVIELASVLTLAAPGGALHTRMARAPAASEPSTTAQPAAQLVPLSQSVPAALRRQTVTLRLRLIASERAKAMAETISFATVVAC